MNKIEEKKILNEIYTDNMFEIQESEQPDFVLKNKNNNEKFGVEVTELYHNESSARLKNYPGYFEKILEKQRKLYS